MSDCLICGSRVCYNCGECMNVHCPSPLSLCGCACIGCAFENVPITSGIPCEECLWDDEDYK